MTTRDKWKRYAAKSIAVMAAAMFAAANHTDNFFAARAEMVQSGNTVSSSSNAESESPSNAEPESPSNAEISLFQQVPGAGSNKCGENLTWGLRKVQEH